MNIYKVSALAINNNGEYILGSDELQTHACYLVYGVLKKDEKGRVVKPGSGHEEIVCIVQGKVVLRGASKAIDLKPGDAFHIRGEETYLMDNSGSNDAVYVIAGGHSEGHKH